MIFFTGIHQLTHARHFDNSFISVNRLKKRKSVFKVNDWVMDSGAFSTISTHGDFPDSEEEYADHINQWVNCGNLLAAVTQDYMCESYILKITGKTVREHQQLTVKRYDKLLPLTDTTYIMPVLQGYKPEEYVQHIRDYGSRLKANAWVGVGSVCKRNSKPETIWKLLRAIKKERPDLRLHGFGIKITALKFPGILQMLYSADSMAWSLEARYSGLDGGDWRVAAAWTKKVLECGKV